MTTPKSGRSSPTPIRRPTVVIDPACAGRWPEVRIDVHAFVNVKVGASHRELEALRAKVLPLARARVAEARDPGLIPTVGAWHQVLRDTGVDPNRERPWLTELLRAVARSQPFRVTNDAIDAARLLALAHAIPVTVHDAAAISDAILFRLGSPGETAVSQGAAGASLEDRPVLSDASGVFASATAEIPRALPTRLTTSLLVCVHHALTPSATAQSEMSTRIRNWFETLTGGRSVD